MKRNIPPDLDSFKQSNLYPFVGLSDDYRIINWRTKSLLNPSVNDGYLRVSVKVDGKNKGVMLHRLVAERFVPLPSDPEATQVNHIDGNKQNNNPSNLEWTTLIDNVLHANRSGLRDTCKGFNHHSCKVDEETVRKACGYMSMYLTNKQIEELLQLPRGFCNDMRRGKIWQDIYQQYDIPVKSNKATIFYLISLSDQYIKFGRTNNIERRLIDTRHKSKNFNVKLLCTYDIKCPIKTIDLEKAIISSDIKTSVVNRDLLPNGFSETTHFSDLQNILQIVEKYKPD